MGYGYINYQSYNQEKDLMDLVQQVRAKEDYIEYEELPETLIRATVAIEDRRFFEHSGIDQWGLLRAFYSQFDNDFLKSGGSTITQQLAKNLYGQYNSSGKWKSAEYHFASELEKHFTKQEIFALYVNIINYGNNYIGISQAAQGYFGVKPSQLSDGQCSILAGIPQIPSNYELTSEENIQRAKDRQLLVLNAMKEMNYISEDEVQEIYNQPIF